MNPFIELEQVRLNFGFQIPKRVETCAKRDEERERGEKKRRGREWIERIEKREKRERVKKEERVKRNVMGKKKT